jgi:hypothetical protein
MSQGFYGTRPGAEGGRRMHRITARQVAPGRWEIVEEEVNPKKEARRELINTALFMTALGGMVYLSMILKELVK